MVAVFKTYLVLLLCWEREIDLEEMDFVEFGTLQSVHQIPSIRVVCCGDSAIGKSLLTRRLTETQLVVGSGSDNDFATVH